MLIHIYKTGLCVLIIVQVVTAKNEEVSCEKSQIQKESSLLNKTSTKLKGFNLKFLFTYEAEA